MGAATKGAICNSQYFIQCKHFMWGFVKFGQTYVAVAEIMGIAQLHRGMLSEQMLLNLG